MKKFYFTLLIVIGCCQVHFSQCGPVTNPTFTIGNNILLFDWDDLATADSFIVQFKELNGTWSELSYSDTVYTSMLSFADICNQEYIGHWRVISKCNGVSDSTATLTFQITCDPPTPLSPQNLTHNSAQINWSAVMNFSATCNTYAVAYRALGSTNWISLGNTNDTYKQVNNLQSNTTYEWCVNQLCFGATSQPGIGQFTTLMPPCNPVTTLNVLDLTNISAKLNWNSVNGAIKFRIQYKETSASQWITFDTPNSNTQFVLSGLTPNTSYIYKVATICANNNISNYSTTYSFITNCISLSNTIEHIRFVQIKDRIRVSTQDPNGYILWNDPPTLVKGYSYTLKIAGGGQINNSNRQEVAAYLDANNNSIFESTEMVSGVNILNNTSARTYSFTVPGNASSGSLRMRIVMLKQNQGAMSPCPNLGWRGEVEDYYVNVSPSSSNSVEIGNQFYMDNNENSQIRTYENEIRIFPNPASDHCIISGKNILSINLYNTIGQRILHYNENHDGEVRLDLASFRSGLWFIEIVDTYGKKTIHKLMKN